MNLQEVLERNKNKASKIQYEIKSVSIATDDRPYDYIKTSKKTGDHKKINLSWSQKSVSLNTKTKTTHPQTGDITDDKLETNWRQTNDEVATKQLAKWGQTTPQTRDTIDDKLETNWRQTGDNLPFSSLTGLQRSIAIFIYNLCKISRDKKTKEVSINQLAYYCNSTIKSVKKSIFRLIEKGIICRDTFKNGRGGWTVYYLPNCVYQEIMNIETGDKLVTNWQQSDDKVPPQLPPKQMTSMLSSGSNYYIKTTTTNGAENVKANCLSDDWLKIDIEPLANIGFTKTHLTQIASQNILSTEVVQDSIYAFAFDLQENNKAKKINGDSINFFMGILRNGKPYAPASNYESPQDKAMRLYRERMREIEQSRVSAEKEAINLAYNDWFAQLTDTQKKEFLPVSLRQNARLEKNKMLEGSARNYFEIEIWTDKKREIIGKVNVIEEEDNEEKIANNFT